MRIDLICKFIEITLLHGCSGVNLLKDIRELSCLNILDLLQIFRAFFYMNTIGGLLLKSERKH